MKNEFDTFPIYFKDRSTFEKAYNLVSARHSEFDSGHADLILTFFSKENMEEMSKLFNILGWKHTV